MKKGSTRATACPGRSCRPRSAGSGRTRCATSETEASVLDTTRTTRPAARRRWRRARASRRLGTSALRRRCRAAGSTWVKPSCARLADAQRAPACAPAHFAGQADLAEQRRRSRAPAGCAGSTPAPRPRRRSTAGSSTDMPAGDVGEDVVARQHQPGALLEHGQQQRHAVGVEAVGGALGVAVGAGADERLHFDQQRPRAFDGSTAPPSPATRSGRSARNSCRRVRHRRAGRRRSSRRRRAR